MKKFKIIDTKVLADSEVEITAEIKAEEVLKERSKAIAKIQKDLTLPGFRPGKVPENMLVKHVGELFIYNEMAEMAINEVFADIITESKSQFIVMPHLHLTKIADKSDVEFKIVGPVMPEIKLADYKKIAKKEMGSKDEPADATDKELDETIEEIRKNFVMRNHEHKEGEEHSHDNLPLPEMNDEFVKKLGKFESVEDFKNKIREGIKKEKEFKNKDKKRLAILEKIIEDTKLSLPKVLLESELRKMQAQFEDDVARAGIKFEDYLKHLKKTREEMQKDWTPDALKRAKLQLIVSKIALEEKLEAIKEDIDKQTDALMKTYPGATEERTRAYVEMMLTNEKVFEWLESQK